MSYNGTRRKSPSAPAPILTVSKIGGTLPLASAFTLILKQAATKATGTKIKPTTDMTWCASPLPKIAERPEPSSCSWLIQSRRGSWLKAYQPYWRDWKSRILDGQQFQKHGDTSRCQSNEAKASRLARLARAIQQLDCLSKVAISAVRKPLDLVKKLDALSGVIWKIMVNSMVKEVDGLIPAES